MRLHGPMVLPLGLLLAAACQRAEPTFIVNFIVKYCQFHIPPYAVVSATKVASSCPFIPAITGNVRSPSWLSLGE